jgi:hypothetical protein
MRNGPERVEEVLWASRSLSPVMCRAPPADRLSGCSSSDVASWLGASDPLVRCRAKSSRRPTAEETTLFCAGVSGTSAPQHKRPEIGVAGAAQRMPEHELGSRAVQGIHLHAGTAPAQEPVEQRLQGGSLNAGARPGAHPSVGADQHGPHRNALGQGGEQFVFWTGGIGRPASAAGWCPRGGGTP